MKVQEYKVVLDEQRLPMVAEVVKHGYQGSRVVNSEDVARIAGDIFGNSADEETWLFCLDNRCRLIGAFQVSHGTVNVSICNPREIYQKALLLGAVSVVLCHNHPSGDVTPSKTDIEATRKVAQAGELIGIQLVDHVIIGDGYASMREQGVL